MMHLSRLPQQKKDEQVVLFLRRHWNVVLQIFLVISLLYLIPAIFLFFFWPYILPWFQHEIFGPLFAIVLSLYVCAVWLLGFVEFVDYYLDVWIVTNKRILNIEQQGLFHRTASELSLNAVQDATSEVKGFLRTIFNFGNVSIQTAGEEKRFLFRDVPHPEKTKEKIIHVVEQMREEEKTIRVQ